MLELPFNVLEHTEPWVNGSVEQKTMDGELGADVYFTQNLCVFIHVFR